MKRILTGDRPTSTSFHLGNYIGSLKNRVKLQEEYDTFILIADLHALTTHFNRAQSLEENIRGLMLGYLSVGLDPKKVTFVLQSKLPETTELGYLLSALTIRSILERQPALKEKLDYGEQDTLALYSYPVLMASDILLPKANLVPVGKDQKAHVEFARDIAMKFNDLYGQVFPIPEPLIGEVPTLPGTDGQAKMGKSLGNAIFLTDSAEEVEKKVMGMYTDPNRIHPTDPGKVEGNPVFIYLDAFWQESDKNKISELKDRYKNGQVGDVEVKQFLVQVLNNFLEPIRAHRGEYEKQPGMIDKILKEGSAKARQEAQKTMEQVRKAMKIDYFSLDQTAPAPQAVNEQGEMITIDDFARVKLRVGKILEVAEIEGSEKLYRLQVDLGEDKPRQILSGIKKWYKTEDLLNKEIIVISNLAPRQVMGFESQGMLLAAEGEDHPVILVPESQVKSGAQIR